MRRSCRTIWNAASNSLNLFTSIWNEQRQDLSRTELGHEKIDESNFEITQTGLNNYLGELASFMFALDRPRREQL